MGRRINPLDDRHYEAVRLLTSVPRLNLEQIARKVGVDRRTLYRWRQRTDFALLERKIIDDVIKRRVRAWNKRYRPNTASELEFIMRASGILR